MSKHEHNYSNILRKITADLEIKDVDLAVGIGVTPSTISNWKNSKSLPYEKDIKRLSKYLMLKLESKNLHANYIDKCLNDVKVKIPESNFNDALTAKKQGKYALTLFLILNSLCNSDRKNKSIKVTSNISCVIENNENSVNNVINTEALLSCDKTSEIVSRKSNKKSFIPRALIILCIATLSLTILVIVKFNMSSLKTNAFVWSDQDLVTTGIQIALDNPLEHSQKYFNNLYNLKNNPEEQLVLNFGYVFADIQAGEIETELGGIFYYNYPYGYTALHGGYNNSNYMSCYIYLTKVANELGNGDIPEKASTTNTPGLSDNDVQALTDYFANGKVGGYEWEDIFNTIGIKFKTLKPSTLNKYKKIFVFGLALHSATDVFRHSAFEERSKNSWTQITHDKDDKIYKSLSNADNPYYVYGCNINNHIENGYSDIYYAAQQIARKVIARYAKETNGTIFDFGMPLTYIEDKNFKIANYCLYAKAAGIATLYSKYEVNFEVGNYTLLK